MTDTAPPFSPAELAALVADAFFSAGQNVLPASRRADLAHRIETALRTALRAERTACAAACLERADLWSATAERPGTPAPLRSEARARANEAAYLADAMRARGG